MEKYAVPPERLRKICMVETELSKVESQTDTEYYDGVIGQERAVLAMEFGLGMNVPGYNIFVVGPHGTGKTTYTEVIAMQASERMGRLPRDWCYIHNFRNEDRPKIVDLPAGMGKTFQKDMEELIEELKDYITRVFEEGEYEGKRDSILVTLQEKLDKRYQSIRKEAENEGFEMKPVPPRFMFVPVQDGRPMPQAVYDSLSPEEKKSFDEKGRRLARSLDDAVKESHRLEESAREEMRKLETGVTLSAVNPRVEITRAKYEKYPKILEYLDEVAEDISENHSVFLKNQPNEEQKEMPPYMVQEEKDPFIRYRVNVFVNNRSCTGAPVVIEGNPNYYNLFGKLEYKSHMLSMNTDFTMLRAGALHQANGGFLILQIRDILQDPYTWETLKKAVKHRKAAVENIGEQYRLVPAGSLRPEPMPLDLKIIIISDPEIYYYLYHMDPDLERLFKVRVDFDLDMPRTGENIRQYMAFIERIVRKDALLPFSKPAMGKVIELGSRLAGDQKRLSTRFDKVTEVIYEAASVAAQRGADEVRDVHVMKALKERHERADSLEERIREQMAENVILIHTEGKEVGQINGLSVMDTGGHAFGMPTRITARTYAGDKGVINIERETKMSGSIHTKGVLTLSGYMGGMFAQDAPLGLTAQVTFEQSYGAIDGDSASSAELYAILSSLSEVPLRQGIAVTGSVDQRGEIQPIGGATEKIEGFYALCKEKGLTGDQGVMIPVQNLDNLMLKDEVVDEVRKGLFHVYAVRTIEEGLEVLTGVKAGRGNGEGFETGGIFDLAFKKLQRFSRAIHTLKLH